MKREKKEVQEPRLLMDLVLPDGTKLRDATFEQATQAGEFFNRVADLKRDAAKKEYEQIIADYEERAANGDHYAKGFLEAHTKRLLFSQEVYDELFPLPEKGGER